MSFVDQIDEIHLPRKESSELQNPISQSQEEKEESLLDVPGQRKFH